MRALAVIMLIPMFACADDKKESKVIPIVPAKIERKDPVDYTKEIQPLFANKCTVCHSGSELKGKFDMGTFAALMKGGRRGVAIVPGKPMESLLYLYSSHNKTPIMPPRSEENPLTPPEVGLLKLWIEQGAKGPTMPEVKTLSKVVLTLPPALVKPVRAVAISPEKEDKATVAASRGNQIHLFDGKTGAFKSSLIDPTLKTSAGVEAKSAHISLVDSLAWSPDGKTLASGSFREVTLWDVEKATVRKRITIFADRVVALAYSPDGKLLATGGGAPTEDGEIKVFDAAGNLAFEIPNAHSDTVFGVCFSPDGKLLATGAADKFVKVFEVPGGKFVKSFEGHTHHVLDVGWAADGKKLVSAGADNVIKVWDYEKGEKARDIQGHKLQVTRLAFIPKTQTFLTASGDASVRLYNADNGGQNRTFGDNKDFMYAVATNIDGAIVAAGGEEGIVRLYNGKNGQMIKAMLPPGAEPKAEEPKKK